MRRWFRDFGSNAALSISEEMRRFPEMRLLPTTAAMVCAAVVLAVPSAAAADEVRDAQWHLPWLDIAAAHDISTGEGVTVGLIDSGVDAQHPDLVDAVQPGAALSGSIDPLADSVGGGTAIGSILAGRGNGEGSADGVAGGGGVLGVAPAAQLVSVSIGDAEIGEGAYVAEAVGTLVDQEVDVILLTIPHPHNEPTANGIRAAIEASIPVVTAAGSSDGGAYPGAVNVVAVDQDGRLASSPIQGDDSLVVAAPGVELPAATPGGGYANVSGPPAAAAIVAGTMALVKAQQPDLAGQALVEHILTEGTSQPTDDQEESLGNGVIDPVAALAAGGNSVPEPATDEEPEDTAAQVDAADNTMLVALIAVGGLLVQVALLAYARLAGRQQPA